MQHSREIQPNQASSSQWRIPDEIAREWGIYQFQTPWVNRSEVDNPNQPASESEKRELYPEEIAAQKILALGALHPADLKKLEALADELEEAGPNIGLNVVRDWEEAGVKLERGVDGRGNRLHRGNPI